MTSKYDTSPPTPTEKYLRRKRKIGCLIWILILIVLALFLNSRCNNPKTYGNIEEHFKYGSIGSDIENGLPVELIKVLPEMFPQYLPEGENTENKDMTAFGFIQEPGRELPIGFSMRQRGVPLAGLNCASCHTGIVRESPGDKGRFVLGMPANQLRLQQFFQFLFDCVADPEFTVDNVMQEMKGHGFKPGPIDRILYSRVVIPQFQGTLLLRQKQLEQFFNDKHPKWGAGRVDTFNPYKKIQFADKYPGPIPHEESIGNSDYPSIWDQAIREKMELHWDGNNNSVAQRNLSASYGAGATRENVDLKSLARIEQWMTTLKPPKFEEYHPYVNINEAAAGRGKVIYKKYCYDCHDKNGNYVGKVVPLDESKDPGAASFIRTSEWRLNSYTEKLKDLQLDYGLKNFKKTNGYANAPLDGIWARAPYLHNGSVPTMRQLLTPEKERSKKTFLRGHGVFDTENLGIDTTIERAGGLPAWEFDTSLEGNSNQGHSGYEYGTELSDEEKDDLIEFLKTL